MAYCNILARPVCQGILGDLVCDFLGSTQLYTWDLIIDACAEKGRQ